MAAQEVVAGEARSLHRPWESLEGKVVMVTGASSGIGWDLCLDLGKAGCRVVAAARRLERLKALCDEINGSWREHHPSDSSGGAVRAAAVELDLGATADVIEAAVGRAWEAFGRIDVLVNNAGIRGNVASPFDLTEAEWNRVVATNLSGTWFVLKFVCKHMRDANQKGSVINISSISGLNRGQLPGGVAYATSKGGLHNMTRDLALELGEHNIRVNCIAPGLFKSEITEKLMQKKWLNNVAMRSMPLRTFGTTDPAMTALVRYLIHDSSDYVSGNVFIADAGRTLPGIPIFSSL